MGHTSHDGDGGGGDDDDDDNDDDEDDDDDDRTMRTTHKNTPTLQSMHAHTHKQSQA